MHVDTCHIKGLIEIIIRHQQLKKFSFHLVHRHDSIANNTVRLESDLECLPGKWNKATLIDSLDLTKIYPVVIKFLPELNRLVPFEFGEGPSPVSATDVNGDFIQEFIGYLIQHNLSNVIALEVVHPVEEHQNIECTAEIEVDKLGTVVLPQSMVKALEFIPTGWPGPLQPSEGDPPAGQSWAPRVNESHKVFINKPIITAKELMDELVCQGVIMV